MGNIKNIIARVNCDSTKGNNLSMDKFLDFWKLHKPCAIEIYLYVNGMSKENNFLTNDEELKIASTNCNIKIVKYLVENGAATSIHSEDNVSLRYSSKNGHIDIVKYLVLIFMPKMMYR